MEGRPTPLSQLLELKERIVKEENNYAVALAEGRDAATLQAIAQRIMELRIDLYSRRPSRTDGKGYDGF